MSLVDGLRHRLYVLLRGEAYTREVERELRFHLELDALSESADGRDARDAELAARRHIGNLTYHREEVRSVTPLHWLDRLRQDASYAWRGLVRTPAFTATVIATLGLGIGVNAAMFSFVDRVLFRAPAGVSRPETLRRLYVRSPDAQTMGNTGISSYLSYPRFAAIRDRAGDSISLAIYSPSYGRRLKTQSAADSTRVSFVSSEFFAALGLRPAVGRFFAPDEQRMDTPAPLAVISDALWRRVFAARSDVLGQTIELNKARYTVIGVAPRGFAGLDLNLAEVWVPLNSYEAAGQNGRPWYVSNWGNYFLGFARVDNAAEVTRLMSGGTAGLRTVRTWNRDPDTTLALITGPIVQARGPSGGEPAVEVSTRVAGVALIVLVIACANVANMLLLRASNRRREIAVRRALGGSRARLYTQLLTESTLLGLCGGGAALVFAIWGGAALRRLIMPTVHWSSVAIDARIIAITTLTAFVVGFFAGLVPAAFATGVDLATGLKSGTASRQTGKPRTQSTLLVVQAALSVVLLVAAGLFLRSLGNVRSIDLGYDREGMLTARLFISDDAAGSVVSAELPKIAERMRSRPGVIAVGLSQSTPMTGWAVTMVYEPGRDSALRIGGDFPTNQRTAPGFFSASGVRLLAGRDFTEDDRVGAAPVIVVDEQMAKAVWPGESPIGKCVNIVKAHSDCVRVVGVVEPVHQRRIIERAGPQYYLPLAQSVGYSPRSIVLRVQNGYVPAVSAALRADLKPLATDQSSFVVSSMDEILADELRPWRMAAILFSGLGGLALIVAAIGIYGVVAFAMSQRTHEMGVRIALGAQRRDILDLVLATNFRVVAIGIAAGIVVALLLGRLVASLLFGVIPNDPSVLIAAGVTMCAIAGIASLVPGWRAARVDPVTSLRAD